MNSMESLVVVDQSFSPSKQIKKTPQNVNPHYRHQIARVSSNNIPRQANNYATPPQVMHEYDKMMMMMMAATMHGGLYLNNQQHAQPYHHHHHHLTNSFPPLTSLGHGQHQSPVLPFPPAVPRPAFPSQPLLRRSQSLSPQVMVPRKAPSKNKNPPKKENKNGTDNVVNNSLQLSLARAGKSSKAKKRSQVSIGPTKENGPNDLTRMMSDVEMDGCSAISPVFRRAPPPSSLPLPRFTLRKPAPPPPPMKLMRCNAEAAAVDGAATDNICMLLRLR